MPSRDEVRGAVRSLRERGRTIIKSTDVADELGTDENHGTLTSIGHHLTNLQDEGEVKRIHNGGHGNSYRILDVDDQEVATDGGHDLPALKRGLEATLTVDSKTTRVFGDYRFSTQERAPEVIVVGYGDFDEWLKLPVGLADVVIDAISARQKNDEGGDASWGPDPIPDGGLPPLIYGECDCGGQHELNRESVDDLMVKFPCSRDGCDWEVSNGG